MIGRRVNSVDATGAEDGTRNAWRFTRKRRQVSVHLSFPDDLWRRRPDPAIHCTTLLPAGLTKLKLFSHVRSPPGWNWPVAMDAIG